MRGFPTSARPFCEEVGSSKTPYFCLVSQTPRGKEEGRELLHWNRESITISKKVEHVRLRRVVGVEETDDLETCASFVKWLWQTHHDSLTQGAEERYKKL